MLFTPKDIDYIKNEYYTIESKHYKILMSFLRHSYKNNCSREFAIHGFARRFGIIKKCIENVFSILPLGRTKPPTSDERQDAIINMQSFVFNAFGCCDNLAWVWVHENELRIDKHHIGLRKSNKELRKSFSPHFQDYLVGLDTWFDYLENFRHALAHRIPLYIPPHAVTESNLERHEELEIEKNGALSREDFDEYERCANEQDNLGVFLPVITHSFGEKSNKIILHAQIITDFNTIFELSSKFLGEVCGDSRR